MKWIVAKYYDWLMHKRLKRCYRLLCHINRKVYCLEDYEEFFGEMDRAYRENPGFFSR